MYGYCMWHIAIHVTVGGCPHLWTCRYIDIRGSRRRCILAFRHSGGETDDVVDMFTKYSGFGIGLSLQFCDCFEKCRVSRQIGPAAGSMKIYMGLFFAHLAICCKAVCSNRLFCKLARSSTPLIISPVTGSLSETKISSRSKDKTTLYCMMWRSHISG